MTEDSAESTRHNLHVKNWELVAEFMWRMAEWTDTQQERDQLRDIALQIRENTEAMKDNDR